jgi:HK97 gp10 family phage protein
MAGNKLIVRIEGADKIMAALKAKEDEAAHILDDAVKAGAEVISQDAADRAPRRTGALARSIHAQETKHTRTWVEFSVSWDRDHYYGAALEVGAQPHEITPDTAQALLINGEFVSSVRHPGISPRPFLRPAFDSKKDEAERAVGEKLREALKL